MEDNNNSAKKVVPLIERVRQAKERKEQESREETRGRKKKSRATYQDYVDLSKQVFPDDHQRDLLSGRLIVKHGGRLHPFTRGSTAYDVFTRHVQDRESSEPAFKPEHISAYMRTYEDTLKPTLLLPLTAAWDNKERLKWFCERLNAKHLTKTAVYEIVRRWLVNVLRKGLDPRSVQNVVLILQGQQGIGKDETVKMLVSIFEPESWDPYHPSKVTYTANITLRPAMPEAEWGRFLCQNLVCIISEFDRVKDAASQATWKDITVKDTADWREMRQEGVSSHVVRASLVATINPPEVNDDPTGCRRLAPVELEGPAFNRAAAGETPAILWRKEHGLGEGEPEAMADILTDREQVLAELMHYLNTKTYELSDATRKELAEVQDRMTPEDETTRAVETFISTAAAEDEFKMFNEIEEITHDSKTVQARLVPPDFSNRIIRRIVKEFGINEQHLRARLNTLGLSKKRRQFGNKTWHLIPMPTKPPSCECGEPILIGNQYQHCPVCAVSYEYTRERLKREAEERNN